VPSPPRWSDWHWNADSRLVRFNLDNIQEEEECGDRCYLEQDLESLKEIRALYLDSALKDKSKSRAKELMRGVRDKDRQIAWVEGKLRELGAVLMVGGDRLTTLVTISTSTETKEEPETVLMVKPDQDQLRPVTISTNSERHGEQEAVLMVNSDGDPTTISTKKRRGKGQGTGRIQWRTVTKKNGKQYQQAWYDWQITDGGKTLGKSTYIPKRLLPKIREMEAAKSPVAAVLDLLGVRNLVK
jgi:hypothetical protein